LEPTVVFLSFVVEAVVLVAFDPYFEHGLLLNRVVAANVEDGAFEALGCGPPLVGVE